MKIIKAKLDIIFKKLFADEENRDLLQDFLSTMLNIPYDEITNIVVENPEIYPEHLDQKFCRLDLRLTVDKRIINVEMQINNEGYFEDRSLFYWAKMYTGKLESGEDYSQLKESIAVNIVNFNLFDCKEYHSCFEVLERDRHEKLTDKFSIHFFELKKINRKPNRDDKKQIWLNFINAETEEELNMINEMNIPVMSKAVMTLRKMSEDDVLREKAELREKALHDETSALNFAEKKGREAGRAEGKAEGIAEVVQKMRALGMSEEQINKIIGNK